MKVGEDRTLYLVGFTKKQDYKNYSISKYRLQSRSVDAVIKMPATSSNQELVDISEQALLVAGSFRRLQIIDKESFKLQNEDFAWASPPEKGQLQMIT